MNEETRPTQPERPLKTTAQVLVDCLEADRLHIPVVNTMMAKDIIPNAGRGHALQGLPDRKSGGSDPHTGRSVPAERAQRHRGAGGLQ